MIPDCTVFLHAGNMIQWKSPFPLLIQGVTGGTDQTSGGCFLC